MSTPEFIRLIRDDRRIRVVFQSRDLGLYGNFRFLIENVDTKYLAIQCVDDQLSMNLLEVLEEVRKERAVLGIATWARAEYYPNTLSFGTPSPGRNPILTSKYSSAEQSASPDPSWFFGVWESSFIKKQFPSIDFDWLDCFVLTKALLSKTIVVDVKSPTLIGTWDWANKIYPSVDGVRHRPLLATIRYVGLTPQFLKLNPRLLFKIAKSIEAMFITARKLNEQLLLKQRSDGEL